MKPLDIGSGSVVAVDTRSLRDAAARFDVAASHFDGARERAWAAVHATPFPLDQGSVESIARDAATAADGARAIAGELRRMADVYEIVEARTRMSFETSRGRERIQAVRAWEERILAAEARSPGALAEADRVTREWEQDWAKELLAQSSLGMDGIPGFVATLLGAAALDLVRGFGRGVVGPDARLVGRADAVRVAGYGTRVDRPATGVADGLRRIPDTAHALIRVEKYTFADRPAEYAVYVSGTRTLARGGSEALDTGSNLGAYFGMPAASYEAVRAALRDAGAKPGATVHAFGHSQGGMIASQLALQREYRVATLVTYGSPVSVVAPPDTLSVTLRNRDDPVGTGLTHGGAPIAGGAPGSVVVHDTHDPGPELWSLGMDAHSRESYERMAEQVDASADPRLAAASDRFAALAEAERVESVEYAAERAGDPR